MLHLTPTIYFQICHWIELQQQDADGRPTKRGMFREATPLTLRRENTFAQIASAAGGLGSAICNFSALIMERFRSSSTCDMELFRSTCRVPPKLQKQC